MTDRFDDAEPTHAASATAHLLDELQLHGYRPFADEPDPRPLPDPDRLSCAVADIFDAFVASLGDTRLEPDLPDLLWSLVNLFHRGIDRIGRELDTNEAAQQSSQRDQDGSEVRSVELERLLSQGLTLIERRNAFEFLRDAAAEHFEHHTGSAWRPRVGSMVSRRTMTAAMIDSRDFLAARRRAETEPLLPPGVRIAFAGGVECNDHQRIWPALDRVHAKHPDMVLLHGGTPKGAERIAACWADQRKVPQIVFKPDWHRHAKAAPFKRNDALLETLPIGVIVFPGSGVTDNLADKAKRLGIPLFDFRGGGGYGRTPEPETPYQRAAQAWDERIGSARVQARNWRLMALGELGLIAGLAAALVWQSARGTIVPWVVQVDRLGEAQAVAPAIANFRPTDPQIAWHLARFIEQVRGIAADPIIVRQNWLRAYDFATDRGALALNDFARASDPFVRQNFMVVDRLFAAAELRLGDRQQRVRIVRTDGRAR